MPNSLCHFELMTNDVAKCKSFYGTVFGWNFDDQAMPGYTLIHTGHEPTGGVFAKPPNAPHPCMNVYFRVESIEQILDLSSRNGGKTIVPKTPIPGVGHFAMFADPEGIAVGVMCPNPDA